MYNFFSLTISFLIVGLTFLLPFLSHPDSWLFWLFLPSFFLLFLLARRRRLRIFHKFREKIDKIEEELNLLNEAVSSQSAVIDFMPSQIKVLSLLSDVSHKLIECNDCDQVLDFLINLCGELFPRGENILVFLANRQNESLALARSLRRKKITIKEKKGDVLDQWVLRQNQLLMIEDIAGDFRFDSAKITAFSERGSRAFMSVLLSIGDKIIGLVRIESPIPGVFSLNDSRLLRSICDLTAVVYERAQLFRHTQELAIKDSLTAVYLRDYFFQRLKEELLRASTKAVSLGIIMVDIDNFKIINDTYGHIVGDLVLKRLAKILTEVIGNSGNMVCRFGGEEFICCLVECDRQTVIKTAEQIRTLVEKVSLNFRRKKVTFTISLGAVVYPADGIDVLQLIDKADQLLYKAKHSGKNKLCAV